MSRDKRYYDGRIEFIVNSLVDGAISRDDFRKNRGSIMIKNYSNEHGTDNSPLSFTILQDQLEEN